MAQCIRKQNRAHIQSYIRRKIVAVSNRLYGNIMMDNTELHYSFITVWNVRV